MTQEIPHKENAPGDFYVEDGCCLACAMPFEVAPDLFAWADDDQVQCIVCKQPTSDHENDQMLEAFQVQDVGCIRYKGSNRTIQIKLIEAGEGNQCDSMDAEMKARNLEVQANLVAKRAIARANKNSVDSVSILQRVISWLRNGV